MGEKPTPPGNQLAVARPKSRGDQPLSRGYSENEIVTDESMCDLQDFMLNLESFKSPLVSRYTEIAARTATPPLTCGNPEDDGLRSSNNPEDDEKKSGSADINKTIPEKTLQQPKNLTLTKLDLNIAGSNPPKRRTFKQIVTLTQDLNYLVQQKYKMPKHIIILG